MPNSALTRIFKNGSRTYFYSSLFFPAKIKEDVFGLYAFVRIADDFIDQTPQQVTAFQEFKQQYYQSLRHRLATGNQVIDSFITVQRKHRFRQAWVDAFFTAMEADIHKHRYRTLAELESYMYGSAEVIGLMMAKIMNLAPAATRTARLLGKAMQYANFIRDLDEDYRLGRIYIPEEIRRPYGISKLTRTAFLDQQPQFTALLKQEIARYFEWVEKARQGFRYLPKRYFIPIATATSMYDWTMKEIEAQPEKVFLRKVKPSVPRICLNLLYNSLTHL